MSHRTDDTLVVEERQTETVDRADDLDELLSDPHCRYLLQYLRDAGDAVPVEAAARHVVGHITDTDPEDVSGDVQRRVQTWLHHGQLPMLDEYGIVAFDPEASTVRLVDDPRA